MPLVIEGRKGDFSLLEQAVDVVFGLQSVLRHLVLDRALPGDSLSEHGKGDAIALLSFDTLAFGMQKW